MLNRFNLTRLVLLLAVTIFAFSCNKDENIDSTSGVSINTIEDYLGMEIDNPENFPEYYELSQEEIDRVLVYVDAQLQATETSELEDRNVFYNYRLFTLALFRTGLINDLINSEVTAFAPNNDAFRAIGITSFRDLRGLPVDALTDILTYHVIPGRLFAADLENKFYATVAGPAVEVNVDDGVTVNDATVVNPDLFFAFLLNGVVHGIDQVLMAPTQNIVEIAIEASQSDDPEFTQLVAAVVRADLAGTLSGPGPFTVFAPTDAAFNALFDALDTDVNSIDIDLLTDVLLYHVVPARAFSTDLTNGPLSTLGGEVVVDLSTLTLDDSGTDDLANLLPPLLNIQGTNGVIHGIDKVLLP